MEGAAIQARRAELLAFFVSAYHLKDALKAEKPNGVAGQSIEDAISRTPSLSLLADLCNLEKHVKPRGKDLPRSGDWPSYGTLAGATSYPGWQIRLPVLHGTDTYDGIELATAVVDAWRTVLVELGCIT